MRKSKKKKEIKVRKSKKGVKSPGKLRLTSTLHLDFSFSGIHPRRCLDQPKGLFQDLKQTLPSKNGKMEKTKPLPHPTPLPIP